MRESAILKDLVIVLIQYEKHSLLRFLGFYIFSSIFLLGVVAFLVFSIQKRQIYENIHNQMLFRSSQIAQTIISQQMRAGHKELRGDFLKKFEDKKSQFTLFDIHKKPIYGEIPWIQTCENFFIKDNIAYLLNQGAYGHLGVEWILIKTNFADEMNHLIYSIVWAALICLVFLMIFGFVLGKMFLKPMRDGVVYLDHFIKDITHELNTPISALMMSANSLKTGVSEVKISRILKACKRIHFLYSNLTFLFLGEIRESKENIDLSALLKNRLEMFEEHFREKQITLQLQTIEKLIIFADKEALNQMVDNLLSNAIKYNLIGGVICLTLTEKSLKVQNSGKPIPKELFSSLKQRYKRGNHHIQGYGIGLDIINKVTQNYDWDFSISIQNNLNTFEIVF